MLERIETRAEQIIVECRYDFDTGDDSTVALLNRRYIYFKKPLSYIF